MPDKEPFFSIITVTLNHLRGLQRTWESVQSQVFHDFEWIVVDGASQDGTLQFLQMLKASVLRWISEPDTGLYEAMNKGIAMAGGNYILFLNAGDLLAGADVLQIIYNEAIKASYPDFIYGDAYERVGGRIYLKKARSHRTIWYGMFTHHQAMIYNRAALGDLRYRTRYKLAADFALTSEFLSRASVVHRVPIPICVFEGGGVTSTLRAHLQGMIEQWYICYSIQKRCKIICSLIFLLHIGKHTVLHLLHPLYIFLRYR